MIDSVPVYTDSVYSSLASSIPKLPCRGHDLLPMNARYICWHRAFARLSSVCRTLVAYLADCSSPPAELWISGVNRHAIDHRSGRVFPDFAKIRGTGLMPKWLRYFIRKCVLLHR